MTAQLLKSATMITFHPTQGYFELKSEGFIYLLGVSPNRDLHHLYWGRPLSPSELKKLIAAWKKRATETSHHVTRELQLREFPDFGHNDLRAPAYQLEQPDGSRISEFRYASYEITEGKPDFGPGPSSHAEKTDGAQTLKISLVDKLVKQEMDLYYTLYPHRDILVRRSVLRNKGAKPIHILKLMSAGMDMAPGPYRLIRFPGAWANERRRVEGPLQQGITRLESRRGIASHEMNPFAMVTRGDADEKKGEVYGFALAYSGNWLIEAELFRTGGLRLNAGLNDFDFQWRLGPGESFTSPECVMTYSSQGFSQLSRNYHPFVRERVARGYWRDKPRPMLINNWEATYFKFNHDRLLKIAKAGKEAGLELMVLDDGWFGKRDDDTSSLGDWFVDRKKLPRGLKGLSDDIHGLGMKFGLWIEPEMISPKSLLYKKHPDWCLHVKGRERRMARSQLVLDMSRPEIRDYLFETIGKVLDEAKVDYVKWDMNRSLSEIGNEILPPSRQRELYHRYMMGVYDLMDRFNRRFPKVLFEGCAGGGARFDLGLMSYHPQIWASDNTDGLDRLFIQYATSFCYPPIVMGAHVSSVPNHQTHRSMPLKWRCLVAMSGNFGVEADIAKWKPTERKELAEYIRLYKEIRPIVQFGDFYRLESPYQSDRASWIFVSPDQKDALLFVFQVKPPKKGEGVKGIRLKGLKANQPYEIQEAGLKLSGKKLMEEGWLPKEFKNPKKPYSCGFYHLTA